MNRRQFAFWTPIVIVVGMIIAGLFAPLPYDPYDPVAGSPTEPPSMNHWFGTDLTGFDVFSRTIRAAMFDMPLAFGGSLLAGVIGVFGGLIASRGGRLSNWMMRALDAFQAFPLIILAVAVIVLGGNKMIYVVVAIALINFPRFMRIVRAESIALRQKRFVEASQSFGASESRVAVVHILPNVLTPILVQATLATANAVVVIAAISFLGVGITPPTPSWGAMIKAGSQSIVVGQWWISVFPGVAIFIMVFCLNWISDNIQTRSR